MQLIADIDTTLPDEDLVEVLIGEVTAWGIVQAQLLFPALEVALEGAEAATAPANERLSTLHELQENIHNAEGGESPPSALIKSYIDGVKYHLVIDVQQFVPLAAQLPTEKSQQLARSMAALKADLE